MFLRPCSIHFDCAFLFDGGVLRSDHALAYIAMLPEVWGEVCARLERGGSRFGSEDFMVSMLLS